MQPRITTLCEYASETSPGSLMIYKTFDEIKAKTFPWRAAFYAVAKVDLEPEDSKDYDQVTMMVLDADDTGETLFKVDRKFQKEKDLKRMNFIAGFSGLKFFHSGNYLFRICLDDAIVVDYKFKVVEEKENERIN